MGNKGYSFIFHDGCIRRVSIALRAQMFAPKMFGMLKTFAELVPHFGISLDAAAQLSVLWVRARKFGSP